MSGSKRIVFACSFGPEIGFGHAGRCASLAWAARRRGWRTALWSSSDLRQLPVDIRNAFTERVVGDWQSVGPFPTGLVGVDCFVVDDMYAAEEAYVALRNRLDGSGGTPTLLATDDMGERSLSSADFVMNQELGLRRAGYRPRRKALLGESFALLRPGLSAPVSVDWQSGAGAKPVFVMIGGTDALGLTADVLEGLWDFGGRGLAPIVVARDDHPQIRRIREILGRFPSHRLLCDLGAGEVAGWSQLCSVAVIACGTSIYEMAALDVPFVGLLVANNQRRMASAVRELWELPTIDCENGSLDVEAFQSGVQMAMAARKAFAGSVDFRGADRVLDALEVS